MTESKTGTAPFQPERWQQVAGELSYLFAESTHRGSSLEHVEADLKVAVAHKDELEKRVKDLERDVRVWREAHEREHAAKEAIVAASEAMSRRLAAPKDSYPLIVCLIDGDGTIFAQRHLEQGQPGGAAAAQELRSNILKFVGPTWSHATVWATVFCNRSGLIDIMSRADACSPKQFDAFWAGFVGAETMFSMVDVGPGKEAADAKLREALRIYSRMSQVVRVFFGGAHDGGYRPPLAALALDGLLDKVVLVRAHDEIAQDLRELKLPTVQWPKLFRRRKLIRPADSSTSTPRATPGSLLPPKALPDKNNGSKTKTQREGKKKESGTKASGGN